MKDTTKAQLVIVVTILVIIGSIGGVNMHLEYQAKIKRSNDVLWEVAEELHAELELTRKLNLDIVDLERISPQTYVVLLHNGTIITAESYISNATLNWRIIPTAEEVS